MNIDPCIKITSLIKWKNRPVHWLHSYNMWHEAKPISKEKLKLTLHAVSQSIPTLTTCLHPSKAKQQIATHRNPAWSSNNTTTIPRIKSGFQEKHVRMQKQQIYISLIVTSNSKTNQLSFSACLASILAIYRKLLLSFQILYWSLHLIGRPEIPPNWEKRLYIYYNLKGIKKSATANQD